MHVGDPVDHDKFGTNGVDQVIFKSLYWHRSIAPITDLSSLRILLNYEEGVL